MKYVVLALAVVGAFATAPLASADCPGCAAPRRHAAPAHAPAPTVAYGNGYATYAQPVSYGSSYSYASYAPATRGYGVYRYDPFHRDAGHAYGGGHAYGTGYATYGGASYGTTYGATGCGGGCATPCASPCESPCGGGVFGRGGFLGTGLFR